MKLDTLRKVIREEVQAAIKEELQDMLNEAVKVASAPSTSNVQNTNQYKPVVQKDLSKTWSTGKINTGTIPLEEMLSQTQREMTGEDYKQITGATSPSVNTSTSNTMANQMGLTENSGPMPGIDISKLDFVKKAKDIYDLANKKTKGQLT
jgi:transglutaminase/protease-like cytokinesis protein 3